MLVSRRKYKELEAEFDEHIRLVNEKILKGNDRVMAAENELRHVSKVAELEKHLRKQAEIAKGQARGDAEIATNAFRTLHKVITEFRADPDRHEFRSEDIRAVEAAAVAMNQSMKEWL